MRILVVDDEQLNRDVLKRRLTRRGYEVVCAENGQVALELLAQEAYTAVLMDLSMPVMDGWEATRHIRSCFEPTQLPVIALSAHSGPEAQLRAREAGCCDYVTKPYGMEDLLARLQGLLGPEPFSPAC
jgi:CheY-like chemotaxis protein